MCFFLNVSRFLKEHGTGIPIVEGDFNETLMPIDRKSKCKNGTIIQPVASLKTLIKTNNLADIWRKCNQDKQQFTWRRKDKTQASPIDMIFIGTDFCSLVETCKIKPVTIQSTDHQSVYINCIPGISEKGRGYWKINNSILQEVEYQLLINNMIDTYIYDNVNNNVDCRLLWDVL
jgi:hypothetical protein